MNNVQNVLLFILNSILMHESLNFFFFFFFFYMLNATFNNISFILWQSVLLVEETVVPVENHQPVTSH